MLAGFRNFVKTQLIFIITSANSQRILSNIFKRIKQLLHLHQIQCKGRDSVEATLRALRVAWVLQDQQAAQLRSLLHKMVQSALSEQLDLPLARPISSWSVSKLCLQTLRHQVLGHWSMARLRACRPGLQRFLTSKRPKRGHQETDVRRWLERRSINQFQPILGGLHHACSHRAYLH